MTAYDVYCTYRAIKLHFQTTNYNYFKYNGRVNAQESSFLKRTDRYFFEYLAAPSNLLITTHEDLISKLIVYLHLYGDIYVKEFVSWCKKINECDYWWKYQEFKVDPIKILDKDLEELKIKYGESLDPLKHIMIPYVEKRILIETLLLINNEESVLEKALASANPVYRVEIEFLKKYLPFSILKEKGVVKKLSILKERIRKELCK